MKEWSMSAGETYVLKASGGSFAFSVQKENDIPPLPVLALGQAVSGTIPETAGYAEYAFTAPESGGYTLNVEGVVERAELRAESYTLTLENEPHTLIEGGSYVYRVYGVSGTEFTLTLEKTADKEISEVAILPEAFDLEYSMYGFGSYALATTGSVARIAYTDNSSWELPAYWENLGYIDYHGPISDGYGNELDWRSRKLGQDADGCQYEIAVRYRTEQDTEWTYHSENVTIPFVSAKADKQLKADIAASGTFNAGGKDYYQISVDQTGKYRFVIAEPELSENCEFQLYSANGSTIDGETNDIFYLQAGRTYYLRIFGGTDAAGTAYSLLMTRLKDLSSIEILSAPEQAYRRIGVLEEEVQLKIHYADGSEEILDGTRVLADGRSVKREYEQLDNTQARLTYTLEDCRVSTLISLAELSAAPQMTADGGKYSISFDNQEAGYQRYRYVMQVTPEYTGEYHLTTASGQPVWNVSAQIYDSNLFEISTAWSGLYLEAGRTYYIVADARSEDNLPLDQLTVSLGMSGSHTCDWQPGDVLKAPTCLEEGEQEQSCSICGASEVIILPALGHEFGEWVTEKEASETETGSKYQECSRCRERIYEIIPSTGTQSTIEEVQSTIEAIEVPEEGEKLTQEDQSNVSQAIGSLTQIDNEELLAAEDSQILDTIEKLDELASGLDSVSETKYEVAAELQSQIGTPEVRGAALTAAAVSEEVSVGEDETLSVKVNLAVSENAYEELQGKTVAVDITMSVVKVSAEGEVTETVQDNVQPRTPIRVTMQIPSEFQGKIFALYHVSGTDRQEIEYTTDGSSITFATPSLSDFVLHLTDCGEGNHTWKAGQILKEATCTEYGRIADLCENCEQKRNEKRISMKAHDWETVTEKEATCSEDGYILQRCKNCQTEQKTTTAPATGAHAFTVVVERNATCGAAGSQHRECGVCGYQEAATAIPATGAHTFTVVVDRNATCGAAGSQHRECSVCGYQEAATVIPAAGAHTFGAFAETKAATAVEEGVRTRTCTVCGAQETEATAKLPATIELSANKVVLKTGQSTKAFKVTEMADGDSVKSIVSSRNSTVKVSGVTADGACRLKAGKKAGSAKLTITLASGLTKTVKVKVQKNAVKTTSIKNLQKKLTLSRKQKIKLMPELNPITSQDKITYSSSNKKVATVTSKGVVKGIKAGKAKITVKAGKKKFVCTVTVRK
ncbi:MAG TPA: Ig-like domain-containing protein [Candidatus Choladousia intestinipullorum]|nr:Ig-like domain-containing protein [Candidatus Choladousia intestinipullorum]